MKGITRRIMPVAIAALVGLASLGPRLATAASRTETAPTTPLYQADWTTGLDGWTLFSGFAVANGVLTFDGQSDSGAYAPFRLKGLTDFAVEATIKVGTSATPNQAYYDIFARRVSPRSYSGLFGGYATYGGEKAARNVAALYWRPDQAYYAPGAVFQPDAGFHTYRLEIHGNAYRLLIDGREMVPWTIVKLAAIGDMTGMIFTYIPAQVKAFRVFALPAAQVTTTRDTTALAGHVIPASDIPFPADSAVFRDNSRYGLDNNVDPATLRRIGRVYGYYQGFENTVTYAEESINLHTGPVGAKAAFDLFSGRTKHAAGQYQGYHVVDLSAHPIGDESFAFSYQYQSQGSPSYVVKVLFHRGNYYVAITVDSADPTAAQKAIAYAHMADGFVQNTGTATQGVCVVC